jgi:hypothetical protein
MGWNNSAAFLPMPVYAALRQRVHNHSNMLSSS